MRYIHQFTVAAALEDVVKFHQQSASMAAITPPPIRVEMHSAPVVLSGGDVMSFTLRTGPIPIHWTASIDYSGPTGFVDRQLSGPFREWTHRHIFVSGYGCTSVLDVVEAKLRRHPLWFAIGYSMWLSLPALFAYRAWMTKRLVGGKRHRRHAGRKITKPQPA